ncbi:hypothetical protein LSTR_LSTR008178 [Laodelphax striatellus]|uniref:Uncharacterized protein n=1 Tax=Laodelphax striatellus TaxID=195883 RepID=A0A482WJV1_LAOST|nr:hypothetical protein LSTR_LSTR008178 [Laodelphax striatellus]
MERKRGGRSRKIRRKMKKEKAEEKEGMRRNQEEMKRNRSPWISSYITSVSKQFMIVLVRKLFSNSSERVMSFIALGMCGVAVTGAIWTSVQAFEPASTIDVFTHKEFFGSEVPSDFKNSIHPFLLKNYFKHSCQSTEACMTEAVFTHPAIILVKPDLEPRSEMLAFVAPQGINSIFAEGMFKTLRDFLLTPKEKTGIFYSPKFFYNLNSFLQLRHLSQAPISKFIFPENFKMSDFHLMAHNGDEIPILALFESAEFEKSNFHDVRQFAKLNVFPDIIEPVPRLFSIPHSNSHIFF